MDISAFSEDTFDSKEWINKTFKSPDAQENKEVFLSSLVAKLQLYVQQINGAVEDTSEHVIQSLPRVMHDADMILKEALMLKEKMQLVKEEIMKIEKDTAASMETLEKLDKMKTELYTAKQALHEADNWTVLASDIEEVFESHKIEAIAEKVMSMQQSLPALIHSTDYEQRKIQLEGFKNRLEAMASPHLVNAFTNKNVEESVKYVKIFTGIERLPQLIKYYVKCEKSFLCQKWKNIVDVDQDRGIQELLSQFYQDLLLEYHTQVKWCTSVFDSSKMVMGVIADALSSLEKDITTTVDTYIRQEGEQISQLVALRSLSDNFISDLKNALAQHEDETPECWRDVLHSVYVIYRNWVSAYRRLEERQLVVTSLEGDLSESVRVLTRERQSLVSGVSEAVKRCELFTSGLGLPALISAVQFSILKHLEQYENVLREIEIKKQSKEEWSMFQICLSLLLNIGELQNTIEELDRELIQTLEKSLRKEKKLEIDLRQVMFTKGALEQYNYFMKSFKEGNKSSVVEGVKSKLSKVTERVTGCCLDVMFTPIRSQLSRASWGSSASLSHQLPDYSYAPLEYITQIGEYLMTLPQHLEPFLKEEGNSPAVQLLGRVCRQTCSSLADLILNTKDVTPNTAKQIAVDIAYLGNVLEDLGQTLPETLAQMVVLLKLPSDAYQAGSAGCSPRLVAAIREMRNIASS
ncbi:unnamed protein product [Nezara viridula]|uniref:Conserved oligomeric Golgi complex subunit 7 n=1 Tax=Nezara viridula TaxID=85310 RepID=A0A9P0H0T1_NEZVI|nr:unnamed protein product [Nezara viridula]